MDRAEKKNKTKLPSAKFETSLPNVYLYARIKLGNLSYRALNAEIAKMEELYFIVIIFLNLYHNALLYVDLIHHHH